MNKDLLDIRYKSTQTYLQTGEGVPVYKKNAFKFINKKLGPQFKWINKSPEEYFGDNQVEEAVKAFKILNFTGKESFKDIKTTYRKGMYWMQRNSQ
jgi:hypothetical protein